MNILSTVLLFLSGAISLASATSRCSTPHPPPPSPGHALYRRTLPAPCEIPPIYIYFNVILPPSNATTAAAYSNVRHYNSSSLTSAFESRMKEVLAVQLKILNFDYKPYNISFVAVDKIKFIDNPTWWSMPMDSAESFDAVNKLHRGTRQSLNVIFTDSDRPDGVNIESYGMFRKGYPKDGLIIALDTVPGGNDPWNNLGKTLTHETGHWLGLRHTFCDNDQICGDCDFVTDTPPQPKTDGGCVWNGTMCNAAAQPWAVTTNFMDYLDDACMRSFTPGQIERIKSVWNLDRDYATWIAEELVDNSTTRAW